MRVMVLRAAESPQARARGDRRQRTVAEAKLGRRGQAAGEGDRRSGARAGRGRREAAQDDVPVGEAPGPPTDDARRPKSRFGCKQPIRITGAPAPSRRRSARVRARPNIAHEGGIDQKGAMAGSYNKVLLMGNLTRDVRRCGTRRPTANSVANIGLAVNRRFRTQSRCENARGDHLRRLRGLGAHRGGHEPATWPRGAPSSSRAASSSTSGRTRTAHNRSKLKVVVENFQFVDSGQGGGGGGVMGRVAQEATIIRGRSATLRRRRRGRRCEPSAAQDDIPF